MVRNSLILTSAEETTEVIEEVLEHNLDDIYRVLDGISDKLSDISQQLDNFQEIGTGILDVLQSSRLNSIAALLLILVGFEIMRLVRGWTKGDKFIGRNT